MLSEQSSKTHNDAVNMEAKYLHTLVYTHALKNKVLSAVWAGFASPLSVTIRTDYFISPGR